MSSLDDDSLSYGSTPVIESSDLVFRPKTNLRDRVIEYVMTHPKATKGDIYIHVSSSGTCQTLMTSLVVTGILIEHKFDCGSCVYYTVDTKRVQEV